MNNKKIEEIFLQYLKTIIQFSKVTYVIDQRLMVQHNSHAVSLSTYLLHKGKVSPPFMQELRLFINRNNRSATFWIQEPRAKINKGILGKYIGSKKFGFPGVSDGKESTCHARDPGSIPGSGRSPGDRNGYPLQYSCLENPKGREACQAPVDGITKESDPTEWLAHTHKKFTVKSIVSFAVCKLCLLIVYVNKHLATLHWTPALPIL